VPTRPIRRLVSAVWRADCVGVGGGTMLQPHFKLARAVIATLVIARLGRKPAALLAVGVESSPSRGYRAYLRLVSRLVALASVRDEQSKATLEAAGFKKVVLAADPILLMSQSQQQPSADRVAVSLRADASDSLVANLAAAVRRRGPEEVLLVPMDNTRSGDRTALERFERALGGSGNARWIDASLPWRDYVERMQAAQYFVGMRLHFTYFGALSGAKLTVLSSSDKTSSFAREFGLDAVSADAAGFELSEGSADLEMLAAARERIVSLIDLLDDWDGRR
jgi:polysaccharide pyruvyl transferase WcaK-like protein